MPFTGSDDTPILQSEIAMVKPLFYPEGKWVQGRSPYHCTILPIASNALAVSGSVQP